MSLDGDDRVASERAWKRVIVVFGDAIVDRYVHGTVGRISPEAPVPIVRLGSEESRLGGAANVAANLVALGAQPRLVSLIGEDDAGARLCGELTRQGIDHRGCVVVPGRPTPEKTRILARSQHVIRLDREDDAPPDDAASRALVDNALVALEGADGLIVSDYAKGTLDGRSVPAVLTAARERGLPTVIDPKIRHFELFAPATVLTPNLVEVGRATAREIRCETELLAAAQEILDRQRVDAVLVTRGGDGMLLAPRGRPAEFIVAHEREVFDVTGAGDTVAATLGLALAAGWDLSRAARLANAAASLAVGRLGTAAIGMDEIRTIRDSLSAGG